MKLSEKGNARRGFFEKAQLDTLLAVLPAPLDDMARFGFATGWRRGELLGLTWEAVSREEVRLGTTKNGEPRSVPLDSELAAIIERRRKAREFTTAAGVGLSAFVFHRNGKPINKTVFGKQWRAACQKVKLSGKLFHDLRRTAAWNMIRAGVPQSVAQRITGHETDSMFRRYDITENRDELAALEAARRYVDAEPEEKSNVVEMRSGLSSE